MDENSQDKSILLFAYGNISRGDDALGPLLLQQIKQQQFQQTCGYTLKFLQDYQIQIEHALDMQACERVILIDASQSLQQPFDFYRIPEKSQTSYTTHGMEASHLLHTYRLVHHKPAPPSYMLAIQGSDFELGQALSSRAEINLQLASEFLLDLLSSDSFENWVLTESDRSPVTFK